MAIFNIDFEKLLIKINEIDFKGQEKNENLYKLIIRIFLFIAIVVSFVTQKLQNGTVIILLGTLISIIVCVPAWSCFNKMNIKWIQHKEENKFESN